MTDLAANAIIRKFQAFVRDKTFPCLGAHSAMSQHVVRYFVAEHMTTSRKDEEMLTFLYSFIDEVRKLKSHFYSAVILFKGPDDMDEDQYEACFWHRLQAISDLDARLHTYDERVSPDVLSPQFSFSLKKEAFYIIGLHGQSSRKSRRFAFPAMVFNTHSQFEYLRSKNQYTKMQHIIRKRDLSYSGSINPMLADFGSASEVYQYTGKQYDANWKCPLNIHHAIKESNAHSTP